MGKITREKNIKIKVGRDYTTISLINNIPVEVCKDRRSQNEMPKPKTKEQLQQKLQLAEQRRKENLRKTETKIKDLVNNNFVFGFNAKSVTLTFDPLKFEDDLTSIDFTHKEFKKLIQRINYKYNDFLYITTFDTQKNGNWHYHMICNFDASVSESDIQNLWGNGVVSENDLVTKEYFRNYSNYLVKNMRSSVDKLIGRKSYLCSKALEHSKVYDYNKIDDEHIEECNKIIEEIGDTSRHSLYRYPQTTKISVGKSKVWVDDKTGEVNENLIYHASLNKLQDEGYMEYKIEVECFVSDARFPEKFKPLKIAKLKEKKSKRKPNNT